MLGNDRCKRTCIRKEAESGGKRNGRKKKRKETYQYSEREDNAQDNDEGAEKERGVRRGRVRHGSAKHGCRRGKRSAVAKGGRWDMDRSEKDEMRRRREREESGDAGNG